MRSEPGSDLTSAVSAVQRLPPTPPSQSCCRRKGMTSRCSCASPALQGDLMLGTLSQQPQLLATWPSISSPHSEKVLLATPVRTRWKDGFLENVGSGKYLEATEHSPSDSCPASLLHQMRSPEPQVASRRCAAARVGAGSTSVLSLQAEATGFQPTPSSTPLAQAGPPQLSPLD